MKKLRPVFVSAALAIAMAAPASAGVNDPEVILYRFIGVADNGNAGGTGISTAIICTNFSGETQNVRFVTRDRPGGLLNNVVFVLNHLATVVAGTNGNVTYPIDLHIIPSGGVLGTTAFAATAPNIVCSATIIDARISPIPPSYLPLHGIRFLPIPGSQE